jgi:hypothetical protein
MNAHGDITRPTFAKLGDQYVMRLDGVLLLAGDALYCDPDDTSRPQGRATAAKIVDAIISAAVGYGFPREAELRLLLKEPLQRGGCGNSRPPVTRATVGTRSRSDCLDP